MKGTKRKTDYSGEQGQSDAQTNDDSQDECDDSLVVDFRVQFVQLGQHLLALIVSNPDLSEVRWIALP